MNLVDDGYGDILYGPARYTRRQKALQALSATWSAPSYQTPQAKPTKPVKASKASPKAPAQNTTYSKEDLIAALMAGIEERQRQIEVDTQIIKALQGV